MSPRLPFSFFSLGSAAVPVSVPHRGRGSPTSPPIHLPSESERGEEDMGSNAAGKPPAAAAAVSWEFHATGPRNLSTPGWRDLIRSSWRDPNYRRIAMSCFVQAAYLLELDRQESRTGEAALAPNWWKPFKYKLVRPLIDSRDGSIYGALLEWDQLAALADLIVVKPQGAPKVVLALRGTVLKQLTVVRDLEDDLRLFALDSLRGSVRFTGALEVLKSAIHKHGSANVCVAGHSLGAGFALQVGKALAKDGTFVECHLFNPPSVSLGTGLRKIQEKASSVLKRYISRSGSSSSSNVSPGEEQQASSQVEVGEEELNKEVKRWVPNLYINSCDYICCFYADRSGVATVTTEKHSGVHSKLYVIAKGPSKFLEAHGLQQWWSDDSELHLAVHDSKLMYRHLKSLYV
ncbi:GDSL esterase/lipase At4g10955-like [Miscanthus floridulus]|uniref:GDSL esterase/lipase At4g10955-like n=1 Tax=Miscanthus floridulus TaxID=154761 RepID=UPI0034583136